MKTALILSYIIPLFVVVGAIFYRIVLTGKFYKGLFSIWLFYLAYTLVFFTITPRLLAVPSSTSPAETAFLEAVCVLPINVFGLLPGLIISSIAVLVRNLIIRFKPSLLKSAKPEPVTEPNTELSE